MDVYYNKQNNTIAAYLTTRNRANGKETHDKNSHNQVYVFSEEGLSELKWFSVWKLVIYENRERLRFLQPLYGKKFRFRCQICSG
jgi:hypothetical protein